MATAITQTETLFTARVEDSITKLKGGCDPPRLGILPRPPSVVVDPLPDIIIPQSCFVDAKVSSFAACLNGPRVVESSGSRASHNPRDSWTLTERSVCLPFELYRPIFAFITDHKDLKNLAVASRVTQPDAERFLHAKVYARGVRQVADRCRFLARYPRVAALVRKIVFRDREPKTWTLCQPLPSFFALVAAALRNTPKLSYLDASILPTNSLPSGVPFRLETFVHEGLVIGHDAVNFFTEQCTIKDLILNPFSYYELHDDDEHYRRVLLTILPNLRSLSCGLSVAIRLVRSRPLTRFVIPPRHDCLDSDQLERVVRALSSAHGDGLKRLVVERRFAGREGLQCITKGLRDLEHLGLVVSYASEWLRDLSSLKSLKSLSLVGDVFFDTHVEKLALEELRLTCPTLSSVYIRQTAPSGSSQPQSLLPPDSTGSPDSSSIPGTVRADHWVYESATGEWSCVGRVDTRALALTGFPWD